MAYWLFKSEPGAWSWENQKAKGEAGEQWDGVRNYQARNFMRDMTIGDHAGRYLVINARTDVFLSGTAEQFPHRLATDLSEDVPQCDIDG